ncbi:MAG: hypothetical protein K2F91_08295, partial [Muribaculaceae bacterium]|nr:hypothetical protein [Muribaculaceae bacterium]
MAKYRYSLGRQTGICPQCGRRSFKFYVDNATGEIVDENCGRCNRENNCRYHSKPNEYVKKDEFINRVRPPCRIGHVSDGYDTIEPRYAVQSPAMWRYDTLFRYLCAVFGGSVVLEAFALCGVTHAKALQGSTVFWLKDAGGSLRSGKV